MEKKSIILRRLLMIFILSVFLLPFFQDKFFHFESAPLKGAFKTVNDTTFSPGGWFSGRFQLQRERFINENFGFRNILVRTYNQLLYTLYKKSGSKQVVIGKKDFLYEENYIKAYYGTDFIGNDSIQKRMQMAKFVQDALAHMNKTLMFVFAPGKASFYPEYIPDQYHTKKGNTNIASYTKFAQELGINYIDFNSYFIANKSTSAYPLFPKYGNHWSYHGMCVAADSMIKYIEHKRNIDIPGIYWNTETPGPAKKEDYDIGDGLNLLYPLEKDKLGYPDVKFENPEGKTKPTAVIISDSFFWQMYNMGISEAFNKSQFWYYNQQVNIPNHQPKEMSQVDFRREVTRHDVIIIMAGEATLPSLGWGFIENSYHYFHGDKYETGKDTVFTAKVNDMIWYIHTDSVWMQAIIKKAAESNISVDSTLLNDAMYEVENQENK